MATVDRDAAAADRRAEYRERLAELADQNPDLEPSELAQLLVSDLSRRQRDEALLYYMSAEAVFAQQYRQMVSAQRTALRKALIDPRRDSDAELPARGGRPPVSLYDRVMEWKEKVPGDTYRPVFHMNRLEIQLVIDQRLKAVYTEVFWLELLKRLHAGLPNDETRVETHFTEVDIAKLAATIHKEMSRGNLRLRIQPIPVLQSPIGFPRQTGRRNTV